MQVVIVQEFGGPDVLDVVHRPAPAPGAGEALVEVAYAPVLFLDAQMRAGRARDWFATLGAAGGLGVLLVQLARAVGAHVIGAVGDHERKLKLIRQLGATAVNYSRSDWIETVRGVTSGAGVEVILDGIGGPIGTAAFELAARGARVCAYGTPGGGFAQVGRDEAAAREVTLTGIEQVQLEQPEARALVERAMAEVAAGRLRPVIGQTFALDQAADAHRAIESRGVVGKTLLEA